MGGRRTTLTLTARLPEKMHVYAPGVEGYKPISWEIDPSPAVTLFDVEYPDSETLYLPTISESVPVYHGEFRMFRDVRVEQSRQLSEYLDPEGRLVLKGRFHYQACDDKVCYVPMTVDLEWTLQVQGHDRERVPEELRPSP